MLVIYMINGIYSNGRHLFDKVPRLLLVLLSIVSLSVVASGQTVTKVAVNPNSVVGGSTATGTVTISPKAGIDGVLVTLSAQSDFATTPQSVNIVKGKTTATFPITTTPTSSDSTAVIAASIGQSQASARLTIKAPTLDSLALSASKVAGGTNVTGTVRIKSAAPAGGLPVSIKSNSAAAIAPESLSIPAGEKSGSFSVSTTVVSSLTSTKITAKLGASSMTVPLTITPTALTGVSVTPASVQSGTEATGKVTLNSPAGPSGALVSLSVNSSKAFVPVDVTVPSGETSATFTVSTHPVVTATTVVIKAKLGTATFTTNLKLAAVPKSPFAGSYVGSFYQPDGTMGGISATVGPDGTVTGQVVGKSQKTLSGSIDSQGNSMLIASNGSGTGSAMGTFAFTQSGLLFGSLVTDQSVPIAITLNYVNKPLMFSGSYAGTFMSGNGAGTVTLTVSAAGAVSGSASQEGGATYSLKGTVSNLGAIALNVTNNGTTDKNTGYAAFDGNGQLIVMLSNPNGSSQTTITLHKS